MEADGACNKVGARQAVPLPLLHLILNYRHGYSIPAPE